jgi:hypothetical protein
MKGYYIVWRLRTLAMGLAFIFLGTITAAVYGSYELLNPGEISWNGYTTFFVATFTFAPLVSGIWLLLELCRGTEEDSKQWEETRRVIREFQEEQANLNQNLRR